MRDSVAPPHGPRAESHKPSSTTSRYAGGRFQDFSEWLRLRVDRLATAWLSAVLDRDRRAPPEQAPLLADFLRVLVSMLPPAMGPHRRQLDPVWQSAAELYGSLGVARGLASGEIVEEFQFLRGALIRMLFKEPPPSSGSSSFENEVLRLNRFLDAGVTQAGVGHTDRLFFDLFQEGARPRQLTREVATEIRHQLAGIEQDLRNVMGA
ncbi:MAG: hypothetical protein BMS9Abin29_1182 [Gemmatimonadota bacterium]|nr:MAG: hypothetical protein BMS9Abin29_1182 [Gemmatimonadota bacterium]